MSFMLPILGALGIGGTAAAPLAAGAISTGGILGSILQGVATVGGLVASIEAGRAEKEAYEQQAQDTEAEKPLEILQGIDRRRSIKTATAEAIGELDTAYSASGVDLSFGSAAQARTEAFRELDLGLESDVGTTRSRVARLTERASNYRVMGKKALRMGWINGLTGAASQAASIARRY